jgi:hypothetical protein
VAELAGCRKSRLGMVGLLSSLIILPVAGVAIERAKAEIAVLMATVTTQVPVGGVEGHPRLGTMVPADGCPGNGPVAVLTVAAQRRAIAVVLAPDPMAVIAARGRPLINPVQMA